MGKNIMGETERANTPSSECKTSIQNNKLRKKTDCEGMFSRSLHEIQFL